MFDSNYWKNKISETSDYIDKILVDANNNNRDFIATHILNSIRNFVEAISAYIYTSSTKDIIDDLERYEIIKKSLPDIRKIYEYNFISMFHDSLQTTVSHYNVVGEYAERIILKYIHYLAKIKEFLKTRFNIHVLKNLKNIPLDLDNNLANYYRKIKNILNIQQKRTNKYVSKTYYIQKKKVIYVDEILFYEYTISEALDNISKFNRFIAYSKIDIFDNYAVTCNLQKASIELFNKKVPINIIVDYNVAIRQCELDKFAKIFNLKQKNKKNVQYKRLMSYIKKYHITIAQILESPNDEFQKLMDSLLDNKKRHTRLTILLNTARKFLMSKQIGYNVVKYLSAIFANSIIKKQLADEPNPNVSFLCLQSGVLVFDKTPYSGSLIQHNPSFNVLIDLFSYDKYEDDIFANHIINECNSRGLIYFPIDELDPEKAIELINKYNKRVPSFHEQRHLEKFGKYIYKKENETYSIEIIKHLMKKTKKVMENYDVYINSALDNGIVQLDDVQKKDCISRMFTKSAVFCIYGAAGTGKSTLISNELKALGDVPKLCLTHTNTALQNLRQKINDSAVEFKTIEKFLRNKTDEKKYFIVVIDECSIVSSRDMYNVLNKINTELLLLAGDIYQLPAIEFGNRYALLRNFIKKDFYVDLTSVYRCKDSILKKVWNIVREIDSKIETVFDTNEISHVIDESIFANKSEDEITLALNYDGVYGINNLNKLLQINNPNKEIQRGNYIFKIGDPILFNDSTRFKGHLYNNLKGIIRDIKIKNDKSIDFIIEVEAVFIIPSSDFSLYNFETLSNPTPTTTLIKLNVLESRNIIYDKDTDDLYKVPFEIAYAISIHRAQGLEYESVKIIITKEVQENISHNVFYTAITRAKKSLTIFWSPESEAKILKSFTKKNVYNDAQVLAGKNKLKLVKS